MEKEKIRFHLDVGAMIRPESGFYEKDHPEYMADFRFYRVESGDRLFCTPCEYEYLLAFYTEELEECLIYTYCYQEEENWAKYAGCLDGEEWKDKDWISLECGWIRITVRRKDSAVLTEEDRNKACNIFRLESQKNVYKKKDCYTEEIKKTVDSIWKCKKESSLIFALLTDSHYVINGGWEDSISNLRAVHESVGFNALIHLGDLTDGLTPLEVTREYAGKVLDDLHSLEIPVYLAIGNHDSNYFHGNPEWMTQKEQSLFYLQREEPWYFIDFEKQKLRCLFLYSFDHKEEIRYGFPEAEVEWVEKTLEETSIDYDVMVFSHVPLLPEMHYWSDRIRNSSQLKQKLDDYVQKGGRILGYVHGHNHADQIVYTDFFPIISIGCSKCEDFKDKKPAEAVTYDRKMGTVTQELWDTLIVNKGKISFIRFGAGEDRVIG